MKKLMLIVCLFIIPLTLASDTQHRFKVYVSVGGDDDQTVNIIDSHLKRELRLLGDVDIVGYYDGWKYIIAVSVKELETADGRKLGKHVIADYSGNRLGYSNTISKRLYCISGVCEIGESGHLRNSRITIVAKDLSDFRLHRC